MSEATIYHNPRCSKSRQTLELLRDQGVELCVIEYLSTPPDETTLESLLTKLGMAPAELIREKEHRQLDLPDTDDPVELVRRMVQYPQIMQRPIVVCGKQARLGRPPKNVLDIIT